MKDSLAVLIRRLAYAAAREVQAESVAHAHRAESQRRIGDEAQAGVDAVARQVEARFVRLESGVRGAFE